MAEVIHNIQHGTIVNSRLLMFLAKNESGWVRRNSLEDPIKGMNVLLHNSFIF